MKKNKKNSEAPLADNIKNTLIRFNYNDTKALSKHRIIRDYENVGELAALFLAVAFFLVPMIAVWILGEPSDNKDFLVYISIAAGALLIVLAVFLAVVKKIKYIRKLDNSDFVVVSAKIDDIYEHSDKAGENYECVITFAYGENSKLKVRLGAKRDHRVTVADSYLLFATEEEERETEPFLIYVGNYQFPENIKTEK